MGKGESRNIIGGFWLWRMAGRCVVGGFERCRGTRRAARHDAPRQDLGVIHVPRKEATRVVGLAARREDGAVSVDGCGSCGEGVPKWESGGRTCANLVNSARVFDLVKICTALRLLPGRIRGRDGGLPQRNTSESAQVRAHQPFRLGETTPAAYAQSRERIACSS